VEVIPQLLPVQVVSGIEPQFRLAPGIPSIFDSQVPLPWEAM